MPTITPLLTPFDLRGVSLRNRFVMAPMTRQYSPDGIPGDNVVDYYRRRAEAGVGLIVTEGIGVDHPAAIGSGSMGEKNIPLLHGDAALAGWKKTVDAVHKAGGVIFPQLWHMGVVRSAGTGYHPDAPSMRPSGLTGREGKPTALPDDEITRPMTESEIGDVIAAFARSAANAKAVGFDGIAIHGAHGYLIDSFFWTETNQRTDQWGGSISNRARFGAEVVKAVRHAIGDLPIMFRYSQWKLQDYDGQLVKNSEELEQLLQPLVDAGVDLFDVSTRIFSRPPFADSDRTLAGWTKAVTGKPSCCVGGVGLNKELADSLRSGSEGTNNLGEVLSRFEQHEFDLVGVGRALLVDPDWVNKAATNQPFKDFSLAAVAALY
ncbi:MAG: 12-oxophytodienoate reductase [Verrucomicrobiaceae bacterium]|nr:12-oxophytodienoate reductase [Verrucomicrobiaceae bacterium]